MTDDERAAWALFRWRLISPLLDPACTRADRREYLAFLQAHPPQDPRGTPWVPRVRTLERYQRAYRQGGLDVSLTSPNHAGSDRHGKPDIWTQIARPIRRR
jgi:putative transposase